VLPVPVDRSTQGHGVVRSRGQTDPDSNTIILAAPFGALVLARRLRSAIRERPTSSLPLIVPSALGRIRPSGYTATVNAAVNPLSTLPVTVASSSAEPSLNTLSLASDTRARFETLVA
jgi:hypothetical protein